MRISDWSSDVCSSDLPRRAPLTLSKHGVLLPVADDCRAMFATVLRLLRLALRPDAAVPAQQRELAAVRPRLPVAHRKSIAEGRRVLVRGSIAGRRILKKTRNNNT